MPVGEVYIRGLAELQRDFRKMSKDLSKELRAELREVAEPVRATAEGLAVAEIRNIGPRWSRMRVGVSSRLVYVAPKERGRLSRRNPFLHRPKLAPLLFEKAMMPALREHEAEIVDRVDTMFDRLASRNGF